MKICNGITSQFKTLSMPRYPTPLLLNWWIPTFILQSTEISNGLSSDGKGGDGPGTVLVEVNNLSPNILLILLIILYP